MKNRSSSPSREYGLWDLVEDFSSALLALMSLGYSVFHLDYVLDPLPPDVRSGDPPPEGHTRYVLSWKPCRGYSLSDELNKALLHRFPVRTIIHPTDDACLDWCRAVEYTVRYLASGEG